MVAFPTPPKPGSRKSRVGNRRTAFYVAGPADLGQNQSLPFRRFLNLTLSDFDLPLSDADWDSSSDLKMRVRGRGNIPETVSKMCCLKEKPSQRTGRA